MLKSKIEQLEELKRQVEKEKEVIRAKELVLQSLLEELERLEEEPMWNKNYQKSGNLWDLDFLFLNLFNFSLKRCWQIHMILI